MKVNIEKAGKRYDVIYEDPPWSYRQCGKSARGIAEAHYDVMSTEDIKKLPIEGLCKDSSILFMWATFPNISEALEVFKAWGFEYKTAAFVWIKLNKKSPSLFWGMGAYTRANAEVCLVGIRKGTRVSDIIKRHDIHSIVESPVEEHSKKPDKVRDLIEELVRDDVEKIELFARAEAFGWDCWGNEV